MNRLSVSAIINGAFGPPLCLTLSPYRVLCDLESLYFFFHLSICFILSGWEKNDNKGFWRSSLTFSFVIFILSFFNIEKKDVWKKIWENCSLMGYFSYFLFILLFPLLLLLIIIIIIIIIWYWDWRTWKLKESGDHPNYSIVEIDQNTEKSPGDLRRLVVIQTPMRNPRLTLI